jgi:transcriptional regulator with XRE-family HTH domain
VHSEPRPPRATSKAPPPRVAFDGPAFRSARERRRLSLRQVAALAEVHFTNLARFERGTRRPTADVAAHLEAALEEAPIYVDVSWREVRRRADLSLREVARRAGIHCTVLSRVEGGERQATREVAQRLARVMGTSVRN